MRLKRWFGLLGIASVFVLIIGFVSKADAADTEVRSTVSEFLIRPERSVPVGIRVVGGGIAAVATTSVSEETVSSNLNPSSGSLRYGQSDGYRVAVVDVSAPVIGTLNAEGQLVTTGDYIARMPDLAIRLSDSESGVATWSMVLKDSSNSEVVSANGFGAAAASVTANLSIATALGTGTYSLVISVRDVADNQSEAVISNLRAESDLKLKQLLSGPNPFNPNQQVGAIEYQLTQSADVDIKIVSMSGRIIWQDRIDSGQSGAVAGFNRVTWDGRSSWGEVVANGPYLIVVVARSGGNVVSARSRLLVLK